MTEPLPEHDDVHGVDDATLGGYMRIHERPPAFEGSDGHPYTVSVEIEKTPDLRAPHRGYLVFPRWAQTGVGIIGHLETDLLCSGMTHADVVASMGDISLERVQELLEDAIRKARNEAAPNHRDPEC